MIENEERTIDSNDSIQTTNIDDVENSIRNSLIDNQSKSDGIDIKDTWILCCKMTIGSVLAFFIIAIIIIFVITVVPYL